MLTNIMVLRTVKENANKAVLDALPSILADTLSYLLQMMICPHTSPNSSKKDV